VQDHNLSELDTEELARYRRETVGMVFQSFNLLPRMTLEESVELPLRLAEVERNERKPRVSEALERVGLGLRRQHRPSELSGGEQQRGALARARPPQSCRSPSLRVNSHVSRRVFRLAI
jgi:putative ABC transport system ATP-binding protein